MSNSNNDQKGTNQNIQIITTSPQCDNCHKVEYLRHTIDELRYQNRVLLQCLSKLTESKDVKDTIRNIQERMENMEKKIG